MRIHQTSIDLDVFVDHASAAEPRDRALPHAPPVEVEDARQLVSHLLEVLEHQPGHPIVDDFADRTAIERRNRCAARHRLGQNEAERLTCLNRIQQRARAAVQLYLRLQVGFAEVHNVPAVHMRRDVLAVIVVFGGGKDQAHADTPRDLNCLQHALAFGKTPEKQQIVVRPLPERKDIGIDPVKDRADHVEAG
jgi:hypothetical protein